ncbi:MAG: hypothetical protein J6C82_08775 [Clostridia bacterium]|nr:hypothetical protein [Clostridia bacterium]
MKDNCDSYNIDDRVRSGAVEDIIDYSSAGGRCDTIIYQSRGPNKVCAIIYR